MGTKGPREEDQITHLPNSLATMIPPLLLRGILPQQLRVMQEDDLAQLNGIQ